MNTLIESLLNDEHGISEQSYNLLVAWLEDQCCYNGIRGYEAGILLAKVRRADATDGRFYFPS